MVASGMNPQGNDERDGNSNKDAVENIQDQDGQDGIELETEKDEQGETKPTVDSARIEGEHPQDDEGGTLTREVWDYIRCRRQDVGLLLQMGVKIERLSKKDAEQAESQDVLYDRMVAAILYKEEVDNCLSLMWTDIQRVTRKCQRTFMFLKDMNVGVEALERTRGVETNERRELLEQDQHKPLPGMKGLSRNELVKEVTKAVTRPVKREVYPADVKDTAVQPCEDYVDFSDDGEEEEEVEEFYRSNDRRMGSSGRSRKDGKTEQKFERFPREARYRTGPWTRRKGRLSLAL